MAQTVVVEKKLLENILKNLEEVNKNFKRLEKLVLENLSNDYGSEEWWKKETEEALEEYRAGKGKSFDNVKDLLNDLHS